MRVRFWSEITRDDDWSCAKAVAARLSPQSPVTSPHHPALRVFEIAEMSPWRFVSVKIIFDEILL